MTLRNAIFRFGSPLLMSTTLVAGALLLPACVGLDKGDVKEEALDVSANSNTLNAVGTLGILYEYTDWMTGEPITAYSPFCSASLISNSTVLTAKHCVAGLRNIPSELGTIYFGIGPDGNNPARTVEVVDLNAAPGRTGGVVGMGRDVGVVYLAEPVNDIAPLELGSLEDRDVGTRFAAIGYGIQDNTGKAGTRKAGSVTVRARQGKLFELIFGSFEGFKQYFETGGDFGFLAELPGQLDTPAQPPPPPPPGGGAEPAGADDYLRWIYDTTLLLDGYEGWVGDAPGDVQPCYGDSGSPLIKKVDGRLQVYGVVSGGFSSRSSICDFGAVYATFGPETRAFLDQAKGWVDPCGSVSRAGTCNGDVAARCTSLVEGQRRVTSTDCGLLAQTCGQDEQGAAACVDPAPSAE
jgi:hypothetical protein